MNNTKFLILIIVLIGVGFGVVFGPRILDQQQADRDASFNCSMYRLTLELAIKYQELNDTRAAAEYGKAIDFFEEGKCTKIH